MVRKSPTVALLTDFGVRDHYVGVMKGVLLSICPDLRIIDLSHEVAAHCVKEAAYLLWASYRYLPKGTIVLVVVDPGVGTARRILVTKTNDHCFISPDNGVLDILLWQDQPRQVFALDPQSRFLKSIIFDKLSATFHGRDIFAPVAAHIARGMPVQRIGKECRRKNVGAPFVTGANCGVDPAVLHIDRFGNIITNILQPDSKARFVKGIVVGRKRVERWIEAYEQAPPLTPCLIVGSSGLIEIVANMKSAASLLHTSTESVLTLIV
jgi:S-adenosylmethionine hydrolase